jgi:hypothetical protein
MKYYKLLFVIITIFVFQPALGTIINIPGDYLTIQDGIDASVNGDTVLVQPGIHYQHVEFSGHNITLGSLYLISGDSSYISSTIIDAGDSGAAVSFDANEDSTAVLSGFTIQNGYGGAIICHIGTSPTIKKNIITDNYCGAMNIYGSTALVTDNLLINNSTSYNGAAIRCHGGAPIIRNNIFIGNECGAWGGAIYFTSSSPVLINNIIAGNHSWARGGGISFVYSDPVLINNVIYDNTADSSGGGLYCTIESNPVIVNCIIKSNSSPEGDEIFLDDSSFVDITYSNISGGWAGEGNCDFDPAFRDPSNFDFHLMSTYCGDPYDSPCIDAGDLDIFDYILDCDFGLGGTRSDMGAYGGDNLGHPTEVSEQEAIIPESVELLQNYPNPFNASTTIKYYLPSSSEISLSIYNLLGQRIETLFEGVQNPGDHTITWDASDFPSGIYFARAETADRTENIKMVLLK